MNKINLNNENLLLVYDFIKELYIEFGKKIKIKHWIFLNIKDNNILTISFCVELKRKHYSIDLNFDEYKLIKYVLEYDNYINTLIDIAIKQLSLKIKEIKSNE